MIDILAQLASGFVHCLTPLNLAMLVIGIVIGLLIGVLPGLTLVMGVALALPFTYKMDVTASIVLLTAMYVSGTYGGAFTAILFRIPGEPIDVPMLWDGYTMGRKGKPAKALGWTLVAALGGGLLSAVVMVALTEPLGLLSVVAIGKGSLANAFISMSVGILISTVGTDPIYGAYRFTFGSPILADGIEFLVVMVGAYGVGEVLTRLESGFATKPIDKVSNARTELPTLKELNEVKGMFFRSSVVGDLIGLLPGAGATIASFVSYGIEARFGKRKEQMGTGIAEGIIAPQAAATASVGGAMVHLLALGIPGSGATAVILGAFMLHGIQPGPQVLANSAPLVYTVFASLFLGLALMCALGYFAIRPLVKILDFPEAVVSAYVLILCFIGALSIRNNITDLWLIIGFGVLGYGFERLKFPVAPLVLGVILGPIAEEAFMNTMISFSNDWTVFFTRPISGTIVALTIIVLLLPFVQRLFRSRLMTAQTGVR
jgi:putative tricarboxylic transport membrane protein